MKITNAGQGRKAIVNFDTIVLSVKASSVFSLCYVQPGWQIFGNLNSTCQHYWPFKYTCPVGSAQFSGVETEARKILFPLRGRSMH
jgi:hypothetical protein